MALSEIEKLERRYAENPQGLTFAPLAEVHRKNGDVTRALELLRPGLTLHPNYIPASIVLGRCHLDLGDLPAAETAFAHVLSLDGENVIALKALADIAERQYRFEEAERLLTTLLSFDRSNDEARQQLERVEVSRRQAGVASSASPDAAEEMAPDTGAVTAPVGDARQGPEAAEHVTTESNLTDELAAGEASPPPIPERPHEPSLAWSEAPGGTSATDTAPLDLNVLDLGGAQDAAPPEGIEIEQPVSLEEPVEPLSGLVGRNDQEPGPDLHVAADSWEVETAEDIVLESSGGSEFQVANAAEELLSAPPWSGRDSSPSAPPATEETTPPGPGSTREPTEAETGEAALAAPVHEPLAESAEEQPVASSDAATAEAQPETRPEAASIESSIGQPDTASPQATEAPASWAPPVAEPPRRFEPDLVVTESMAELLVQQGLTTEALTVYRHLESRTAEERFRERIAQLERATATAPGSPAPASSDEVDSEAATSPAPKPAYSVRETHGQSVQSFLRTVLGARPPAAPAAAAVRGESPRSASDAASGAAPTRPAHDSLSLSSVFGEESTPTPPAVPAAGPASAGPPGGLSYDEFFGAPGGGAARAPRGGDAKSDDLDQFHAWLQNLKR